MRCTVPNAGSNAKTPVTRFVAHETAKKRRVFDIVFYDSPSVLDLIDK
jgi:hypothetical protein